MPVGIMFVGATSLFFITYRAFIGRELTNGHTIQVLGARRNNSSNNSIGNLDRVRIGILHNSTRAPPETVLNHQTSGLPAGHTHHSKH